MSLIKSESWRYEREYRILANPEVDWGYPFDGRYVSFPPELLTGITLGMSVSSDNRNAVLQWSLQRNPPLTVWEAFEDSRTFTPAFRRLGAPAN
jgi:hypothetical protein